LESMNNQVIEQQLNRRSVRDFTGESVKDEDLSLILKAAQQAPNAFNAQFVSLIVTREKDKIQKIAKLAGDQPQVAGADVFITVVVDFKRGALVADMVNKESQLESSAEGIIGGALDAGIMLSALESAINSLGYGSTIIGGIRNDPEGMVSLLELPTKTFPIAGITIGVPDESKASLVRPRLPLESFAMAEKYDVNVVKEGIVQHDKASREWWDKQNLNQMPAYIESVGNFSSQVFYKQIASSFSKQGFEFKNVD